MKYAQKEVKNRWRTSGLTLVELLLGLAILSLVATTTAGMISAVAYGTDGDRDLRALVARNKMLGARINAAVRGGRMLLDVGEDANGSWAVVWHRDLDGNGEPSLLEIRRLDYDAAARTLSSFTAPEGAADVLYAATDDFATITTNLMGSPEFLAERWADDAEAFDLSHELGDPQLSSTLSYRLSLTESGLTDVTIGTVWLRNRP